MCTEEYVDRRKPCVEFATSKSMMSSGFSSDSRRNNGDCAIHGHEVFFFVMGVASRKREISA